MSTTTRAQRPRTHSPGKAGPHVSPFRYPGGKSLLRPTTNQWLSCLADRPHLLVEPFAGGASVSLDALHHDLVDNVLLVERDAGVASVWQALLTADANEEMRQRIETFACSRERVKHELSQNATTPTELAWQTLLRNRVADGGRLTECGGLKGDVADRWYPQTLSRRSQTILGFANRLRVRHGCALKALAEFANEEGVAFFIDPPYSVPGTKSAGRRLYRHWHVDHERIFALASSVRGDVLLTYDDAPAVRDLCRRHGFDYEPVALRSRHGHSKELLIARNLRFFKAS